MNFISLMSKNKFIVTLSGLYFFICILGVFNIPSMSTSLAVGYAIYTVFLLIVYGVSFCKYFTRR